MFLPHLHRVEPSVLYSFIVVPCDNCVVTYNVMTFCIAISGRKRGRHVSSGLLHTCLPISHLCLGSGSSHRTRLLVFPVCLISWLRGCSEFSGKCLASGLDMLSLSMSGDNDDSYDKDDRAMSGDEERKEAPLDSLLASTAEPGEGGRSRGHKASGFLANRRVESSYLYMPVPNVGRYGTCRYLPLLTPSTVTDGAPAQDTRRTQAAIPRFILEELFCPQQE